MKKKILIVFLAILIILTGTVGIFMAQGYQCYQDTVRTESIQDAVSQYTSKAGYTAYENIDTDLFKRVSVYGISRSKENVIYSWKAYRSLNAEVEDNGIKY
ncbi:MAG: hypothetical protein EOM64_06205, partial [Erysipelotrichia bacterium]|nr:hypothetical protein [Erysipelotrichia bacterium]